MEAEVYPEDRVGQFVSEHFVPVKIHVKERPQEAARFRAEWTPTVVLADPDSTERHRWCGYLPAADFLAQLQLGLGRAEFGRGCFEPAQRAFETVVRDYPETGAAPEALYWSFVSAYKLSHNRESLQQGAIQLRDHFPTSDWAKKASVWLP